MKKTLFLALFALGLGSSVVSAAPTLDSVGVDVGAYAPVVGTALGAIIAAAIGVSFSIFLIRRGIGWIKGMIR